MNARKELKFLLRLVCLALCLMMAVPAFSEGETASSEESITIVPSEAYYPGNMPPKDQEPVVKPDDTQIEPPTDHTADNPAVGNNNNWNNQKSVGTKQGRMAADGITYQLQDGIITVIKVTSDALKDGAVVIPGQLKNYQGIVRYIFADAFNDVRNEMTSLELPETIMFIWNSAFTRCDALKTIRFHGSETQWNVLTMWVTLPEGCTVEFIGE